MRETEIRDVARFPGPDGEHQVTWLIHRNLEHLDVPPKYELRCSCGWRFSKMVRSEKNAMHWTIRHAREIRKSESGDTRNGGPRRETVRAVG